MNKGSLKILLNLALIAGDALVRGGRMDIAAEEGEIVIRAEGPRIVLDPEIRAALEGKTAKEALTPRAAAAWLVHSLARKGGGSVAVSEPDGGVLMFGAMLAG